MLFLPQIHQAFHSLLNENSIAKRTSQMDELPMEIKYAFVELSSLGVLLFTDDKIEVAKGMESWMQFYWREMSCNKGVIA